MQFLKQERTLMYERNVSHGGRGRANTIYSVRSGCFKDFCETLQVWRSVLPGSLIQPAVSAASVCIRHRELLPPYSAWAVSQPKFKSGTRWIQVRSVITETTRSILVSGINVNVSYVYISSVFNRPDFGFYRVFLMCLSWVCFSVTLNSYTPRTARFHKKLTSAQLECGIHSHTPTSRSSLIVRYPNTHSSPDCSKINFTATMEILISISPYIKGNYINFKLIF
jgi:hypothetical protein